MAETMVEIITCAACEQVVDPERDFLFEGETFCSNACAMPLLMNPVAMKDRAEQERQEARLLRLFIQGAMRASRCQCSWDCEDDHACEHVVHHCPPAFTCEQQAERAIVLIKLGTWLMR